MAIKRAIVLSEVIEKHVTAVGHGWAEERQPERAFQKDADLIEIWGKHWRSHPEYRNWGITYNQWLTGALRRSVEDAMLNLPTGSRDKIGQLVRKRYKLEPEDQEIQ